MKNPKVSVVITIYNEADVLEEAADTMLAQTYRNMELILVDNGSRDDTWKILQQYKKNKKVKLVRMADNDGPGGGRNKGAKEATGEILIFVDADMAFDKNYVKKIIKPITEQGFDGAAHDTELVKNVKNIWARSWSVNRIEGKPEFGAYRAVLRKKFVKAGGFDTSKGYFDDELHGVGPSKVTPAVCYHNNPEKLSEVLNHSLWVGRSMARVPGRGKKIIFAVILSWVVTILALLYGVYHSWFPFLALAIATVLALLAFTWLKAIPRMIKEKRPEYILSIPIVLGIRITGSYLGACQYILFRKI